ncbi:MAG: hypothetical protein KDB03_13245 [Planctomycetales bacterium]|nr:hypothetical protein [Planctomycetales bacterium]
MFDNLRTCRMRWAPFLLVVVFMFGCSGSTSSDAVAPENFAPRPPADNVGETGAMNTAAQSESDG